MAGIKAFNIKLPHEIGRLSKTMIFQGNIGCFSQWGVWFWNNFLGYALRPFFLVHILTTFENTMSSQWVSWEKCVFIQPKGTWKELGAVGLKSVICKWQNPTCLRGENNNHRCETPIITRARVIPFAKGKLFVFHCICTLDLCIYIYICICHTDFNVLEYVYIFYMHIYIYINIYMHTAYI